jgi:hypothetical protein
MTTSNITISRLHAYFFILVFSLILFLLNTTQIYANTHSAYLGNSSSSHWFYAQDSASLSNLGNFTMEAWVNVESEPQDGDVYVILSKWQHAVCGDVCNEFAILYEDRNGLQLSGDWNASGLSSAPTSRWSYNVDLGVNEWHHIAVTCDVSVPACTVYIDGVGNAATMELTNAHDTRDTNADFAIGSRSTSTSDFPFYGLIDEVRVWNGIRTAEEIASNFDRELTGSESNLAGYWKFNNNGLDSTVNGNDLLTVNNSIFVSNVPFHQNTPPVLIPVADQTVTEGSSLSFMISATDPDNDTVTLDASNTPAGSTFVGGIFSWTPSFSQEGVYTVSFTATDNGTPSETSYLNVVINVSDSLTTTEQVEAIISIVIALDVPNSAINSYLANLKKVGEFIEQGKITPALNQLHAFINKIEQDYAQEILTQEEYDDLIQAVNNLIVDLS